MEEGKRRMPVTREAAIARLERLCSIREMCESQVLEKLKSWNVDRDQIKGIVELLVSNKYVDNRRFAVAFTRDKYRFNSWGPSKIRMSLKIKGIDKDLVEDALLEIAGGGVPKSVIREVERKAATTKAKNEYELRMKLVAFGVRKGFGYEEMVAVVDEVLKKQKDLRL